MNKILAGLVLAAQVCPWPAGAQSDGYTWETSIVSPHESWDESTVVSPIVRAGAFQNLSVDENGTLSIAYRVGIRFPGSFTCLQGHDIAVTLRATASDESWGTASWEPASMGTLTFLLAGGAHPDGVDWQYQDGPRLVIQWDLDRAPASGRVEYYVVAFPEPAEGPTDCQPKADAEGLRYLSRLSVTRAGTGPQTEGPAGGSGDAKGLGLDWALATGLAGTLAALLRRRNAS